MIPRRTVRGIFALSLLVALSFWLHRDSKLEPTEATRGLDTRLDYALQQFQGRYFDRDGRLAGLIEAPTLTNDASSGIGRVERPRFELVQDNDRWTILSDEATVTADRERVLFSGAVRAVRRATNMGPRVEVSSEEVTLEIAPRMAHSQAAVTIREGANILDATGFRLDMNQDRFELFSDVRGRYEGR